MKIITTNNALKPSGHYSQAVIHENIIYISGQLAIDPNTGDKKLGTASEETSQILHNLNLILEEAGSNKNQVLKTTIYISDISLWDSVNEAYSIFFDGHKPARAVVPTKELHFGFKVEIDAIAYKES